MICAFLLTLRTHIFIFFVVGCEILHFSLNFSRKLYKKVCIFFLVFLSNKYVMFEIYGQFYSNMFENSFKNSQNFKFFTAFYLKYPKYG